MRLLITTQVVDRRDPVLGFFHQWLEEFAKRFESIEVICLREGEHALPKNVRVHSLGKEHGAASRLTYTLRFLTLAWRLRRSYDAVFVHMNQEYVLVAGWLWKLLGKRLYLWRNHYAGSWLTDIAVAFCAKVFCTSKYSYTAKYQKTVLMPVGIDTDLFAQRSATVRVPRSVLFVGRMAPSKRVEVLVEALRLLRARGIECTAAFYGNPSEKDRPYYDALVARTKELGLSDTALFHAAIPNTELPSVYSAYEAFINLSPSGMYDKTIFESMACGCLTLASNDNLKDIVDTMLVLDSCGPDAVAKRMETIFALSDEQKKALVEQERALAEENSLTKLADALRSALEQVP